MWIAVLILGLAATASSATQTTTDSKPNGETQTRARVGLVEYCEAKGKHGTYVLDVKYEEGETLPGGVQAIGGAVIAMITVNSDEPNFCGRFEKGTRVEVTQGPSGYSAQLVQAKSAAGAQQPAQKGAQTELGMEGLVYQKLADGRILILDGFTYSKQVVLGEPMTTKVSDVKGVVMVFENSLFGVANDAVGVTWLFAKAGLARVNPFLS
jgi:hypothetical protein